MLWGEAALGLEIYVILLLPTRWNSKKVCGPFFGHRISIIELFEDFFLKHEEKNKQILKVISRLGKIQDFSGRR